MTVNIGLGIGTREQNLLHLNAIAEKQAQIVEAGGMNLVVTPKNIYNTAAELVKNANLKTPAMFFTDPGDAKAPPPSDEQQKLMAQQQELEKRRQQLDAVDAEMKQQKLAMQNQEQTLKHEKEMIDLRLKMEAQNDHVTIEMEKIRNAITKMELDSTTDIPGSRV
jgi:flagellar motor protein MotB